MDRASARISVQLRMVSGPVNLNSSKASARFLWPASRARPLINMRSIVNLFLVAFAIHEPPLPPSSRRNRADKRGSGRSNRFPLYFSISSLLLPPRLRRFPGSTETSEIIVLSLAKSRNTEPFSSRGGGGGGYSSGVARG